MVVLLPQCSEGPRVSACLRRHLHCVSVWPEGKSTPRPPHHTQSHTLPGKSARIFCVHRVSWWCLTKWFPSPSTQRWACLSSSCWESPEKIDSSESDCLFHKEPLFTSYLHLCLSVDFACFCFRNVNQSVLHSHFFVHLQTQPWLQLQL